MEIRDLKGFLAVARCGSFTAAATELGYTQSAVSQQVAALEQELGRRLLERRPVRVTPAGARLVEHASRIMLRIDAARSELAQLDPGSGHLAIGVCPLAAPDVLARALRRVRARRPALRVTVRSLDAARALSEVAAGDVDLALVDGFTAPGNPLGLGDAGLLLSTALVERPVVVALPAGHPLASRRELDLEVLADAPWVAATSLAGAGPGGVPGATTSGGGMSHDGAVTYDGTDVPTLLSLVAAGHGSALLPAAAIHAPGIVAVPLGRPSLVHRTEALMLRASHPGRAALIDELRAAAAPERG